MFIQANRIILALYMSPVVVLQYTLLQPKQSSVLFPIVVTSLKSITQMSFTLDRLHRRALLMALIRKNQEAIPSVEAQNNALAIASL